MDVPLAIFQVPTSRRLNVRLVLLFLGGILACMSLSASPSNAAFGISGFESQPLDEVGALYSQAGGHPASQSVHFSLNTTTDAYGYFVPEGEPRDIQVDLPPGFIGNPQAIPRCRGLKDLLGGGQPQCPASTQVGFTDVTFSVFGVPVPLRVAIYNMTPPPDAPAAFAFRVVNIAVYLTAGVRTDGDYGVRVSAHNVSQALSLVDSAVTLWGVPADPSHDTDRFCADTPTPGCASDAPDRPFLTLPTACKESGGPFATTLRITPWDTRLAVAEARSLPLDALGAPLTPIGCDKVAFQPQMQIDGTTDLPDTPTGLTVEVSVPDSDNKLGLAQSTLRKAVVRLPDGMSISPSGAHGLDACGPADIGLHSFAPAQCPMASRLGSVDIETPLLAETLHGDVFLASQGDNPFGSTLAMYLVAAGPGVTIKLAGLVEADHRTGNLQVTFDNTPQLPFSRLVVRLKGGPQAPLATPQDCGVHMASATFYGWSGAVGEVTDPITIRCPGATGFSPTFHAGLLNPVAGSFSPFALQIQRDDVQQVLQQLDLTLPGGVLAAVRGVDLCPISAAAKGTCDPRSRIGTVTVQVGPGPTPYPLNAPIYLTDGYRGGPYGLAIVVRAVAGPLDLGTVVIQQRVSVGITDARLRVDSDPFPTLVEGIPIRLRTVDVKVDRPGFTVAPTSCDKAVVQARLGSQQGTSSDVRSHFQVGGCDRLRFTPRIGVTLVGRRQTRPGRHPGLIVSYRQGANQAHPTRAVVELPTTLALDPANANALCEYEAGLAGDCPPRSVIGTVSARTPLLNSPLTGKVYFVKGVRFGPNGRRIRTLPTLLIQLRGDIALDLRATSSVRKGHLVTTLDQIPDAALSQFRLVLRGGRGGILAANRGICSRAQSAAVQLTGHNGRRADQTPTLHTPCTQLRRSRAGRTREPRSPHNR